MTISSINKSSDVHIWLVDLAEPSDDLLQSCLSAEEKQRAQQFHQKKSRSTYLLCRTALRKLLSSYTGILPSKLDFTYNQHGKPALASKQNTMGVTFNLSHTDSIACIAFTTDSEIGVDIEEIKPLPDGLMEMSASFMNDEEMRHFNRISEGRENFFYHTWVQKEAYLKAMGTGLLTDPTSITSYMTKHLSLKNQQVGDRYMNTYSMAPHLLALCSEKPVNPQFFHFTDGQKTELSLF